jgi:hypothetical protein
MKCMVAVARAGAAAAFVASKVLWPLHSMVVLMGIESSSLFTFYSGCRTRGSQVDVLSGALPLKPRGLIARVGARGH